MTLDVCVNAVPHNS